MLEKIKTFQKAAQQNAAFCILILTVFFSTTASYGNIPSTKQEKKHAQLRFEEIKKKITSLTLLKQRDQALQTLAQFESAATDIQVRQELLKIRQNILMSFLSPEAQDFYELSATQVIQNTKQAERNNQKCLAMEPENIQCLWQELRILSRKRDSALAAQAEKFLEKVRTLPDFKFLALSLQKSEPHFLSNNISVTQSAGPNADQTILPFILEFERSVTVQNFSRAKEMLTKIESIASDYPDLLYMKTLLAERSAEPLSSPYQNIYNVYRKKCESVSGELTRKYYYDIDLCNRG